MSESKETFLLKIYIKVWLSMMSGHDANSIFVNKKIIKIGRPEHSLTPYPRTSDSISFWPYPLPIFIVANTTYNSAVKDLNSKKSRLSWTFHLVVIPRIVNICFWPTPLARNLSTSLLCLSKTRWRFFLATLATLSASSTGGLIARFVFETGGIVGRNLAFFLSDSSLGLHAEAFKGTESFGSQTVFLSVKFRTKESNFLLFRVAKSNIKKKRYHPQRYHLYYYLEI